MRTPSVVVRSVRATRAQHADEADHPAIDFGHEQLSCTLLATPKEALQIGIGDSSPRWKAGSMIRSNSWSSTRQVWTVGKSRAGRYALTIIRSPQMLVASAARGYAPGRRSEGSPLRAGARFRGLGAGADVPTIT